MQLRKGENIFDLAAVWNAETAAGRGSVPFCLTVGV